MLLYQVPIILPLFGDHEVKQGSIKDKDVHDSLHTYYPIGKLWADKVHYSATLGTAFQLIATAIAASMLNLAPEELFY